MDLLVRMVEHHIWLTGQMVELASQLSAEQLDQPIEISVDELRSVRSLLSRLIDQMDMWNCVIADRPYDWTLEDQ